MNIFNFLAVSTNSSTMLVVQELEVDGQLPEKSSYYQGVFYNYFSIGVQQ